MSVIPKQLITEDELKWLAGEERIAMARNLLRHDAIRIVEVTVAGVTGIIENTPLTIETEVLTESSAGKPCNALELLQSADQDDIEYKCHCAAGSRAIFCEHLTGLALLYLEQREKQAEIEITVVLAPDNVQADRSDNLTAVLEKLGTKELLTLLLKLSKDDVLVAGKIDELARQAASISSPDDLTHLSIATEEIAVPASQNENESLDSPATLPADSYSKQVNQLFAPYYFSDSSKQIDTYQFRMDLLALLAEASQLLSWQEFQSQIDLVFDNIGFLLDDGIVLSDQDLLFEQIQTMHLNSCTRHKPDPEMLAESLLFWEKQENPFFKDVLKSHAQVLGVQGTIHYQQKLESFWQDIMTVGGRMWRREYTPYQQRLLNMLESAARVTRKYDFVEKIHTGDDEPILGYSRVADFYLRIGQAEMAKTLLESLVGKVRYANGLRSQLAEIHESSGDFEKAAALLWDSYHRDPHYYNYKALHNFLVRSNYDKAAEIEKRCLLLYEDLLKGKEVDKCEHKPKDSHDLIEICLLQGNYLEAWRLSSEYPCRVADLSNLAEKYWQACPAKAYEILKSEVERSIDEKKQATYARACQLLLVMQKIAGEVGTDRRFLFYCNELRQRHQLKISLLKQLDDSGLFGTSSRSQAKQFHEQTAGTGEN